MTDTSAVRFPTPPGQAGLAIASGLAVLSIVAYWLLLGLDVGGDRQFSLVAVVDVVLALAMVATSIVAFRDPFNPAVQIAAYSAVYFAFAFGSDGSALDATSITAFFAATTVGILFGATLAGRWIVKVPILSPHALRICLLGIVALGLLAFTYLVQRLGGLVAFVSRSYELSFLAREEGIEIFFLPGTVFVSVVSVWLAYLRKGVLFAAVVATAVVVSILSFRRANVFYLLMALLLYWHYFVRRLRMVTLVPLGAGVLALMLFIGSARLGGIGGVAETGLLASLTGLDPGIYESYHYVLGENVNYDLLATSGGSITSGLQFLLPSFLVDRGEYQTVPDVIAGGLYGATTYGTPGTLFGSLLIYLPPLVAPLFAIIPGLVWGRLYALLRHRHVDRGAFLWYLASVFFAFDFFRTGDPFHSIKMGILVFGTLIPVTFLMRSPTLTSAKRGPTDAGTAR
jgi:hypothetical protein